MSTQSFASKLRGQFVIRTRSYAYVFILIHSQNYKGVWTKKINLINNYLYEIILKASK